MVAVEDWYRFSVLGPFSTGSLWAEIPMKKYILTNQMKNEYFQENEKKIIEITREMILFDDPNEIIERKSKTEGKWLQLEGRRRMRNTRKMTLFDDESTKMIIIFIYEGYGVKNRAWILSKLRG